MSRPSPKATVYFTSPENGGPIRIGCCSIPVGSRIKVLNTLLPEPLAVLGTISGYKVREAMILLRLRRQRVRGDWFRPTLELWKLIGEAAETGDLAGMPPEPNPWPTVAQSLQGLAALGCGIDAVTSLLGVRAKLGRCPQSWGDGYRSPASLQALHLGISSGWLSLERDFGHLANRLLGAAPAPEPVP